MNKRLLYRILVSLIFYASATQAEQDPPLLVGLVQFPHSLTCSLGPIPITYNGNKLETTANQNDKNVGFLLPRSSRDFSFKLLITDPDSIERVFLSSKYEANTGVVNYQKLKKGATYRFFHLLLEPTLSKEPGTRLSYSWRVSEQSLSGEKRIPDDAVIMHVPAEWVSKVDGSKGFEFPTVCMKEDLVELMGSEMKIKERMNQIAIAATFSSPFSAEPQRLAMLRPDKKRIILAPPARHVA